MMRVKKCGTLHDFACHPCAGANFSIRAISGFLKIVVTRSSVKQKRPNIGNWCIQGDMAVDIWIVQKTGIRSTRRPTDRPHLRPTPPTEEMSERWKLYKNVSTIRPGQKMWNASRFCVSSLRRGHANLLCIVPILVYVQPKLVHLLSSKQHDCCGQSK